jgi:putative transcriptional regulator
VRGRSVPLEGVIAKAVKSLYEGGFEISRPYANERSSINIVARSGDRLILIKALNDTNELRSCCVAEIKKASYALRGSPLVVSERDGPHEIDREAAYEKQGLYVVHPEALRDYFEGRRHYVYYRGGRFYVKIDGKKLREIRERIGLSLGGLASLLGVTRKAVYEYEKGEIDATVDVASKLYDTLSRYVGEEEALQAFKPIDILDKTLSIEDKERWIDERSSRSRLQEEVALKLARLGFSIFKFKEAPFNIIARRNGEGGRTLLILTLEALSDKFKEELEVLRGVAEVAKVKRLVVTRKVSRENGVISAKELDDVSSPEELIEVASSG